MSYKNLEVWQLGKEADIDIHAMILAEIPKYDRWKEGTQLRRSSKKMLSEIVEAYGKRKSKQQCIKYLNAALDSNKESRENLKALFDSGALTDRQFYDRLHEQLKAVGKKLQEFIQTVERDHTTKRTSSNEKTTNELHTS